MRNLVLIFLFFLVVPQSVFAHGGGHAHEPISSEAAKVKATDRLKQLVAEGEIDASWLGVTPRHIDQKRPDFALEWVVEFKNNKISDETKHTIYLFFSLDGEFIASSHDGT